MSPGPTRSSGYGQRSSGLETWKMAMIRAPEQERWLLTSGPQSAASFRGSRLNTRWAARSESAYWPGDAQPCASETLLHQRARSTFAPSEAASRVALQRCRTAPQKRDPVVVGLWITRAGPRDRLRADAQLGDLVTPDELVDGVRNDQHGDASPQARRRGAESAVMHQATGTRLGGRPSSASGRWRAARTGFVCRSAGASASGDTRG